MRIKIEERTEPRKRQWWHIPLLLLLMVGTIYIIRTNNPDGTPKSGAWPQREVQRCEGDIFGTFYHITYQYSHDIEDSLVAVMNEVDRSLSPFNEQSIITAVNHNQDIEVNEMFRDVLTLAKQVNEQTSGGLTRMQKIFYGVDALTAAVVIIPLALAFFSKKKKAAE